MEAMAAGLPALVTPGVNLASDVEAARAGWVVPSEPDAFADALGAILSDRDDLRRRGAAARALASGYRWTNSTAHLLALYDTVRRRGGQ
jgi:glycosyltransferase involved in cell wall biosynthesis